MIIDFWLQKLYTLTFKNSTLISVGFEYLKLLLTFSTPCKKNVHAKSITVKFALTKIGVCDLKITYVYVFVMYMLRKRP